MTIDLVREEIAAFLGFTIASAPVPFVVHGEEVETSYRRCKISYPSVDGEWIPAFLLVPEGDGPFPAVVVHHQHAGQRHLGKSEVCGLAGEPLQAFGPALARQGFVVLAPDSICFEDRRRRGQGIEPDDDDVAQHYDEMCYRLLRGDTLMRKVLSDSAQAVSLLLNHPQVNARCVGMLGHSYGGSTVLFHGALDMRIQFACSSGAAASYRCLMDQQEGIEMSKVIPGFIPRYDIADLVACFGPRPLLVVSATEDWASLDAPAVVAEAQARSEQFGDTACVDHMRFEGEHGLTQERFDAIVSWLAQHAVAAGEC